MYKVKLRCTWYIAQTLVVTVTYQVLLLKTSPYPGGGVCVLNWFHELFGRVSKGRMVLADNTQLRRLVWMEISKELQVPCMDVGYQGPALEAWGRSSLMNAW